METLRGLIEADEERPGEFRDDIRIIKTELRSELERHYWGALVRSREQRVEFEAQPSKLFRAFERERVARKKISEVGHSGGIARGREEVAAAFDEYYTQLFRSRPTPECVPPEVLGSLPTVPDDTRDQINAPITVWEVDREIKKLPKNKSPGPDGIIAEFYQAFRKELGPFLATVFEDITQRGLLPRSMRESHLVLIPKNPKSDVLPAVTDFRPITLLSTDYKILARILARRLETALRGVVGGHQTCGFKGRSINTNLHRMRTVCEAAEIGVMPLAVLQLDFRKAFDQVDRTFLFTLLRHCGVGEK